MEDDQSLEITTKMLAAIVFENTEPSQPIAETVTIEEQMRYLQKYIGSVPTDDRKDIGRILLMNNRADNIVECSEGVVINMDKLPEYIVNQMYTMLRVKIEKLSK